MRAVRLLAPLFLSAALASCQQPRVLSVDGGYVRLPAVAGNPGVAYFTLHGGNKPATLVSVTSASVIRSELHESMASGGMASMAPIKSVTVQPGASIAFAPGGKHAMLFDINKAVKSGSTMPLIFTFAEGVRIQFDAPVIAAGDPAPKG